MKKRHIPVRMCVVSKEKLPKNELVKITRVTDKSVVIDSDENVFGRSFYLKPESGFLEKAISQNAIKYQLGVVLSDEEKERLIEEFEKALKTE